MVLLGRALQPVQEQFAKETLLSFLKVYSKKFFIKVKMKQFLDKLIHIQQRFKRYVFLMKSRMDLLRMFWDQEVSKMVMHHMKIKYKTKKQKDTLMKLKDLKFSIKEKILS